MKRLVLFHIIQTYVPTGMLVSISWMSFWLDPRASPARISLTITSLLTLTTMSNGARQDLPQVSYIKALDIWLTFSQALIFLVLLEYSFVSFYITRRVFDCPHRTCYFQSQNTSPNNNHKQMEDERIRIDEATEVYPFARDESPPPAPRPENGKAKSGYSLTKGLTACMNHTAVCSSGFS
ncbi:Neurotransmitter-gated ion-channel transmembrane region [Ancylostoma caninum]|uniref:Neurotransmitter-gated ion-channel transmembrane region n=1 Tax=Ancylostoma caninum TaxID=29170 RepID=A0A368FZN6_ANCCA|nr:Neurotransmitter-gated ion-channel transmembrane region [Ancylostoma caninum]